jgi:hypothetical protein
MTFQMNNVQINEKEARKLAAGAGLKASKLIKELDGSSSLSVGALTVRHDGKGGAGTWKVFLGSVNLFPNRGGFRRGEAIYHAVQKSA